MPTGRLILLGFLTLPIAEIAAFWLVADTLGSFAAMFLLLCGSVTGLLILAGLGRRLLWRLFGGVRNGDVAPSGNGIRAETFIKAVGALLLALPGFVTGMAGVLLMVPFVQRRILTSHPGRRHTPDGVIDLEDSEWERIPESPSRRPQS